jgi:subtilisin
LAELYPELLQDSYSGCRFPAQDVIVVRAPRTPGSPIHEGISMSASNRSPLTWDWLDSEGPKHELVSSWPQTRPLRERWSKATGRGVRVCVLDSGIALENPMAGELEASYAVRPTESGGFVVGPETDGDSYGHGIACASIIRRKAPECSLTSLRVLGAGLGTGASLLFGLDWAIRRGFDIINMSLSVRQARYERRLRELADLAYFRGTTIVCSAHNSHVESYPWRLSSVVSVGSHAACDEDLVYYNPQPPVEFLAKGRGVRAASLDGKERNWTGNSFAAPLITGRCALIKSAFPEFTPIQIKCALILSADNMVPAGPEDCRS